MDRRIKHSLLTDTLNIIGLEYMNQRSLVKRQKKVEAETVAAAR
jgi:hypothetical protein